MNALAKLIVAGIFFLIGLQMLFTFLFSRPNNPLTYYDVLGVSEQASHADIKREYRRLVREMHPDRVAHHKKDHKSTTENKWDLDIINQAYNTLSAPNRRVRYDYSLSQPNMFHRQVVEDCARDKTPRVMQYDNFWDDDNKAPIFKSIGNILIGYTMKYPQWAEYAKQIYSSSGSEENGGEEIHPKPYILVKVKSHDNTITYHFSDWQDQLDRPKQLLYSTGMILFTLISAVAPLWFVCAKENTAGPDDDEMSNMDLEQLEGMSLEEMQALTNEKLSEQQAQELITDLRDRMKAKQAQMKQKQQDQAIDKAHIRALNEKNKQLQLQIKKEREAKEQQRREKQNAGRPDGENVEGMENVVDYTQRGDFGGKKKDEVTPEFGCKTCKRTYQSQPQYEQHMASKSHLKAVKEKQAAKERADKKQK